MLTTNLHDGSVLDWATLAVLLTAGVVALGISWWLPRQAKQDKRLFLADSDFDVDGDDGELVEAWRPGLE